MPRCLLSGSVRVPSQYHSAKCAEVVHVFCPLRSQPLCPSWTWRDGLQLHRRGVGPRVRFAVAHGELDVVLEDHREELRLQEVAALRDERLADDADALADLRAAASGQRLVEEELVDAFALAPAVLLRPGEAEPALVAERLHEGPALGRVDDLRHVLAGHVEDVGVVVGVEELLHLGQERQFLRRELEIHDGAPGCGFLTARQKS